MSTTVLFLPSGYAGKPDQNVEISSDVAMTFLPNKGREVRCQGTLSRQAIPAIRRKIISIQNGKSTSNSDVLNQVAELLAQAQINKVTPYYLSKSAH